MKEKCVGCFLGALLVVGPAFAGTISIQPPTVDVGLGKTFSISIDASTVADLYALQFDLAFNPAVLAALSISEGAFLPSGGATLFAPGTIDNIAGTVAFNADSLVGAIPGVTGSGTLATVQFRALTVGSSLVSLSNVTMLDSSFGAMAVGVVGGEVNVQAIPEPGTLGLLVGGGLGVVCICARRRARVGRASIRV